MLTGYLINSAIALLDRIIWKRAVVYMTVKQIKKRQFNRIK